MKPCLRPLCRSVWLALVATSLTVGIAPAQAATDPPADTLELVVSGQLQSAVVDGADGRSARTETTILLRDGTRLRVRRTPDLPLTGTVNATVQVEDGGATTDRLSTRSRAGLRVARSLVGEPVLLEDVRVVAEAAAGAAAHRAFVAVVRNHGSWGDVTTATLQTRVGDALDGWGAEAGAAVPSFEVADWQDFTPDSGCGLGVSFWNVIDEAAAELYPTVDFTAGADHLVVLVPDECETDAVGTGSIGTSLASGGYSVNSLEQDYGPPVLAHELGHNFGLGHATGWSCDEWSGCGVAEYVDLYDVMGGATRGSVPALNSAHRDDLGLLAGGEVTDLTLPEGETTASRTVTIAPRSDATGLRSLRLVNPETLEPWYVDYRSGTSRDTTAGYRAFPDYGPGVVLSSGEGTTSTLYSQQIAGNPKSWETGTTFTSDDGTIHVHVDAIDPGVGATVTAEVASSAPELPAPATVAVTGETKVLERLWIDRTPWPEGTDLRVRWFVDGDLADVGDGFWIWPEMRGQTIVAEVRGTLPGYRGVVRRSADLGPVTNPITGTVAISAQTLDVGKPVVSTVSVLPVDATKNYQWYLDGAPVPGATASGYTPTAADRGGMLQLEVSATRAGYDDTVLASNVLGPVPQQLAAGSPSIDGTPVLGSTLTASPGTWPTGTSLTYHWLRNGSPIAGATGAAYDLAVADVGRDVAVRVRGTKPGFAAAEATSTEVRISPGTLEAASPRVVGRAKVGHRLRARPGSWTAGTRFGYVWLADDRPIRRAHGTSLLLKQGVRGKRISVRVTGTKPGYNTAQRTSPRTRAVRR